MILSPQTYAWEWGHPQFDPGHYKDWANFVKTNPYARFDAPRAVSERHIPGEDASAQPEADFPNYPY